MELDWSAQSPHIRSLFHPWQPGDGYDEDTIQAAEARLGARLPATLRNFYKAWGKRRDLTDVNNPMLNPDNLVVAAGTLIFWVENQAVWYWGVQSEALEADDPPVVFTASGPSGWKVASELNWMPGHAHLSSFLDDMTYLHAFCGGAIHGGWTQLFLPRLPEPHVAWLEENWNKGAVGPIAFQCSPEARIDNLPTLYVRDGAAFWSIGPCSLAARDAKIVDEIAERFQIQWAHRW